MLLWMHTIFDTQYLTLEVYVVGYKIISRWQIVCIWEIFDKVGFNLYPSYMCNIKTKNEYLV